MKKLTTLFISDLHLEPNEPQAVGILERLLYQTGKNVEKLYILGDLFEKWMGDDDLNPFSKQIIQLFKKATDSGLPIYFMHGNRDFLIGKKFAALTGIQLLPDPTLINLYGTPTLLMHGDSLCTLDKKFQAWRKFYSNPIYLKIGLFIFPLWLRRQIGKWLRRKSCQHQLNLDHKITDVSLEEVLRMMQAYKVSQLIHGHTHRPAVHSVNLEEKAVGKRYVLGSWENQKPIVLFCDPSGCRLTEIE